MRKDYGTRTKMANGGKFKMVTNKEGKKVPFSDLSVTGRIVNAYSAIKMADAIVNSK